MGSPPKVPHHRLATFRSISGRCLAARAPHLRAPADKLLLGALVALVALCVLTSLHTQPAVAQQPEPAKLANEYSLKAVFLYRFGLHVEWPEKAFAKASDPFVIGILGEDPFGRELDRIAAKTTVQGRRIAVRRFASPDDYRPPCHILFVSRSVPSEQQAAVVAKLRGEPVMLVGETPGFAERGAIANFFVDGEYIRFELNVNAARRAQLSMKAQLLSLGKPVGTPRSAPE